VFVILAAILDFVLSNLIYRQRSKATKKLLLITSITINLGLLCYFKYTNFFINIINNFTSLYLNPLNIILPIGISFYTFENISYTVDVYKNKIKPVRKFSEYLLFLSFFPKLVMGPIVRAADFIPQISKPYYVSQKDFSEGFYMIISGLFKKLIISDYLTLNFVNYIFSTPKLHTGLECLLATYGYAIIIYCDFSGYSGIAIGIARWLGFKIPDNFNLPYRSTSLQEFWKRWHISLSSWLQDYLYIPLGGNRKGKIRTYVNLMITMLLGGLWHGANWTFIVWGGLQGIGLAIHRKWNEMTKNKLFRNGRVYNFIAGLVTFHFVCFCWIFFKSANFHDAFVMLHQIIYDFHADVFIQLFQNYQYVIYMMLLGYVLHFLPKKLSTGFVNGLSKVGLVGYVIIFLAFVLLYGAFKAATPVMPIYLQF
jgi:D-alanyl-lipoteichoic acid acyltransferase DltB (MBOAT superfamily)